MDDTSYFKSGGASGAVSADEIGASGGGGGNAGSGGASGVGSSAGTGGHSSERDRCASHGSASGNIRRRSTSNSSVNRRTLSKVCIDGYCIFAKSSPPSAKVVRHAQDSVPGSNLLCIAVSRCAVCQCK